MSEQGNEEFSRALRDKLASRPRVNFQALDRRAFEERFVEPNRPLEASFFARYRWILGSAAVAFVALAVIFLRVSPRSDRQLIAGAEVESFAIAGYGEIKARRARMQLGGENTRKMELTLLEGECLVFFSKDFPGERWLTLQNSSFRITGTVIYASKTTGIISVLEGRTQDQDSKELAAGKYRNLGTGAEAANTRDIYAAASALGDVAHLIPRAERSPAAKQPSLADKIFEKYGNVYSVVLRSQSVILAAKVKDAATGEERLYTLNAPLYVSESEIVSVTKIR